jgi:hypothetical protein
LPPCRHFLLPDNTSPIASPGIPLRQS